MVAVPGPLSPNKRGCQALFGTMLKPSKNTCCHGDLPEMERVFSTEMNGGVGMSSETNRTRLTPCAAVRHLQINTATLQAINFDMCMA